MQFIKKNSFEDILSDSCSHGMEGLASELNYLLAVRDWSSRALINNYISTALLYTAPCYNTTKAIRQHANMQYQ